MKDTLVSVIVPNYNHASYLRRRIDSILNQTYRHFELILLDDCSTDNSLKILEEYATNTKVTYLKRNNTNSNSTFQQWKKGIDIAKGEFIWIAESDDFANEYFLERLLPYFADPTISLVQCNSIYVDEEGSIIDNPIAVKDRGNTSFSKDGNKEINEQLIIHNSIVNASAILYRKSVLNRIDFPDDFQFCGDWWINIEMLRNQRFYYCSQLLNYYRISQTGVTFRKDQLAREKKRFREYLKTIRRAFKYARHSKGIDLKKHAWLAYEWYELRDQFRSELSYYFPPLPFRLSLLFYYNLMKSDRHINAMTDKSN